MRQSTMWVKKKVLVRVVVQITDKERSIGGREEIMVKKQGSTQEAIWIIAMLDSNY